MDSYKRSFMNRMADQDAARILISLATSEKKCCEARPSFLEPCPACSPLAAPTVLERQTAVGVQSPKAEEKRENK